MTKLLAWAALLSLTTTLFADPLRVDLDLATTLAETNSFELNRLLFQVKGEQRRYRLQIRNYLPQVAINYADSKTVQYYAPDSRNISISTRVEQPVFQGGRTRISRELQKSNILLQQQGLESDRQSLHNDCFTQFYSYLIQIKKIKLLEQARKTGESQIETTRVEYEVGVIREIDYLETQLQFKELEQRIVTALADLEEIDYTFKLLIGVEPVREIELEGEIEEDYAGMSLKGTLPEYLSIAGQSNLSMVQSRFQIAQERAKVLLSETTWIPNISLEASASISGDDYPLQDPGYALSLIFQFPYEWFPLRASVGISSTANRQYGQSQSGSTPLAENLSFLVDRDIAKLDLQAALEAQKQLLRNLEFSLSKMIKTHEQEKINLLLLRERIDLQTRIMMILKTELDLGEAKRIDYIEAQNELLDRRLELLEAVLNLIIIERSFEQLLGLEIGELVELETLLSGGPS